MARNSLGRSGSTTPCVTRKHEEVFSTPTDAGPGYAIRWTIPLETQVMGARENGEIMFTKMGEGTLMSYNNATRAIRLQAP